MAGTTPTATPVPVAATRVSAPAKPKFVIEMECVSTARPILGVTYLDDKDLKTNPEKNPHTAMKEVNVASLKVIQEHPIGQPDGRLEVSSLETIPFEPRKRYRVSVEEI